MIAGWLKKRLGPARSGDDRSSAAESFYRGLFDDVFYTAENPDVAAHGRDRVEHYRSHGEAEGRRPNPLFDPSYYAEQNRDVVLSGVGFLAHYLAHGEREGRWPVPLFDPKYYADQNRDVGVSGMGVLAHYLAGGECEGRLPVPLFDPKYYAEQNPDVVLSGMSLLAHYLAYGEREGRRPVPLFDPKYYAEQNPDVVLSGMGVLAHYLADGEREGRRPVPLFDPQYYAEQNPDVVLSGMGLLTHYLADGECEGRLPVPLFDPMYYREQNPDVALSRMSLLAHYLITGEREGRRPTSLFDPQYYREQNPDVACSEMSMLAHYLAAGGSEGRNPNPLFDSQYVKTLYPHGSPPGTNPLVAFLNSQTCDGRHPHPLFDAAYQIATTPLVLYPDRDALADYLGHRSSLDPTAIKNRKTTVPGPRLSRLPRAARADVRSELVPAPLISVVMPTYNSAETYLRHAVNSVRTQQYHHWELIIVDDGSTNSLMPSLLADIALSDSRIRVMSQVTNGGISHATNIGLEAAKGDFIALLDHDDIISRDALVEAVYHIGETGADVVYSDQAYVSADGRFDGTFHKPGWSPVLMCGVMYVGHLLIVRRDLALAVGGFDPRYDRAQDFEFMLRVGEKARRIIRIPKVLYEWRRAPGSIAADADAKGKIEPIQEAAVNAHFARKGIAARAFANERLPHRLRTIPATRRNRPAIDVIIRGDRTESLLQGCTSSLSGIFGGDTVVLEPSRDRRESRAPCLARLDAAGQLSAALAKGTAPFVLLADPIVEPSVVDWIDYLLLYAEQDGFGFAGPHLVTAAGEVAAAGLIVDAALGLVPAFAGAEPGSDGYAGALACDREVSALPYAFLLAKRQALEKVGLPSSDYADLDYVAGDLTYRATLAGLTSVSVASLGFQQLDDLASIRNAGADRWVFIDRYRDVLAKGDDYYNPNFSVDLGSFYINE